MGSYRFIEDLKSDVMFEAEARSISGLIEQSCIAMFSVICKIRKIKRRESFAIEASGDDEKSLLVGVLSRLLTESEIRRLFLSKFEAKVAELEGAFRASVTAYGEPISQESGGTVVKGVAYYGLVVEKTKNGYRAHVALDV
jgi:SHS2 domain-containing protein